VVLVHGRAGNRGVMWIFSKALEKTKPLVVSPEAPLSSPLGGHSWWIVEGGEEEEKNSAKVVTAAELEQGVVVLERFIERVVDRYPVDRSKIFGFGFSQGAALLSTMTLRTPQVFQGVALLSGFIPEVALTGAKATDGTLPGYFIFHGTEDDIIPVRAAERADAVLRRRGAEVKFVTDEVGHKISSRGMKELTRWSEARIRASSSSRA
jgi:phospholipase/carboxylesterase